MTEVKFFDPGYEPETKLTYSVIAARYNNKWLFVRHHKRDTLEIAGGHIEENESSGEAARRELKEETGASKFLIECIATYSVRKNRRTDYGRLYFAEVFSLNPISDISEIADLVSMDNLPENLTQPNIQPHLFTRVLEYLKTRDSA